MKALITGSKGFVGTHLTNYLKSQGVKVVEFNIRDGQNLLDYELVRNTLDIERPDYIYHLAAQAFVPESLANPQRAVEHNVIAPLNLLEAVRQLGIKTKIQLAGTSEEYGDAHNCWDGKITEDQMPRPKSPYAVAKLAMDHMGQTYADIYGMHIVVTRAFNHTGPGRGEMYAESSWAKQLVEIEMGSKDFLEHGNLETIRNFTDVRDIVRAYSLAIELTPGVYNICSDQNVKMEVVLDILIENARLGGVRRVKNAALLRSGDFSFGVPNCSKFVNRTAWKPEYNLEQTMIDLLQYWREKLGAE